MKTPDEIKKDIIDCMEEAIEVGQTCDVQVLLDFSDKAYVCMATTRAYIQQLEAANAEKDKRIAELEQELEAAKLQRDAAVSELPHHCWNCKYHLDKPIEETDDNGRTIHRYCDADCCYPDEENSSWEWRGVCPENTEVQDGNQADNA